jgi:hypothetical protein
MAYSVTYSALAGSEGMPGMPIISPKKTYSVPSKDAGEELQDQRGFGDQEPMVRMMNLMMVGGSGYEGMNMEEMGKMEATDHAHMNHQMTMAENDHEMGNMSGTKMQPTPPKTAKPAEGQTASYDILPKITPDPPTAGANTLDISVENKNTHKPVPGLKLKVQVYMTSMDMGTEEPRVKEISPGKYRVKVVFSMKGPWAVKLSLPEGGEKTLAYEVEAKK